MRVIEPLRVVSCLGALAICWYAAQASAQSKPAKSSSCAATPEQVAELEQAGHLRQAKQAALACSQPSCGTVVVQQCRPKYQLIESEMPSVIPVVQDESGQPLLEVEVRMDGEVLCTRIDGSSHDVDPGMHEFSFSAPNRETQGRKLLVVRGERNRQLQVSLVPASSPAVAPVALVASAQVSPAPVQPRPDDSSAPAAQSSKTSVWPYVVGGSGLVALGASVALVTWGHSDLDRLDACEPNCSQDSLDHVQNLYLAADITLGVGVVAVGVSTWMFLSGFGQDDEPGADHAGYRWDVVPTRGGAFATLGRPF